MKLAGITSCAFRRWVAASLALVLAVAAGSLHAEARRVPAVGERTASVNRYRPLASSGSLRLLTYNVAGLPSVLSASNPAVNTPEISPLLNDYDVVLAQEDFSYHEALVEQVSHRYQKSPRYPRSTMFGDGLSVLSHFPVASDHRVRWRACNGYLMALSDCFAEKGFAAVELRLARRTRLAVINVHGDAGSDLGDVTARRSGFAQLARYIDKTFKGAALIVAGDTNLDDHDARDRAILSEFMATTGLSEVCRSFECRGQNLDRVLYRSSATLQLDPVAWGADRRFVDDTGQALSDHPAMSAQFKWRVSGSRQPATLAAR